LKRSAGADLASMAFFAKDRTVSTGLSPCSSAERNKLFSVIVVGTDSFVVQKGEQFALCVNVSETPTH